MDVAGALLALVSDDDRLVARVIEIVPAQQAKMLYASSLAQLARTSPSEALSRARKIEDSIQRKEAVSRVLSAWAQSDPRAVADYLAGLDVDARREAAQSGVWYPIAGAAPELALERADTLPEQIRTGVRAAAIQSLAQRDPKAALAWLTQIPRGAVGRDGLLPMIAHSYATQDAEGALAWARSLQPPQPGVMSAVISGLAEKDPARAFDLASEIASPMEQTQALQAVVNVAIVRDPASAASLLDRVLAMPNSSGRQALVQMAVSTMAAGEPAKAAEWLIANPAQSPDVVAQVASAYARTDPARAASYAGRFTGDARVGWLRGVAGAYAQVDARGALDWVEQLRGTPEYDDTAFAVVQSASQQDPASAARLLDSISREDYRRNGILSIGMRWTNTDPVAAASWASNLHDPTSRTFAVQAVGSAWAQQDAPAAKEWVLAQPPGQARDGALVALVSVTSRFGAPDASLLAGISTEQGRFAAVQTAAMTMAQRDPDGARAFVETNLTDPEQRQRVLSVVSQFASRRLGGPPSPVVGAMFPAGMPPPGMITPAMRSGVVISQGQYPGGSVQGMTQAPDPQIVRSTHRP